jgi:hypothetical protein
MENNAILPLFLKGESAIFSERRPPEGKLIEDYLRHINFIENL